MATVKNDTFLSCDKKTRIHVVTWVPDRRRFRKPVAILQIMHGMIEYIERYDGFARFMAEQGVLVVGNDHLGHGHSVISDEDLGFFCDEKPEHALVLDAHRLTTIMKKKYPDVPYILMGHSMGSFMARKYICMYGDEIDGVIIMGTGHQPTPVVLAGKKLIDGIGAKMGERYRSEFLSKTMFGSYGKRITDDDTPNAWLTRDKDVVAEYNANKYNTFLFTVNGYKAMMKSILYGRYKENIRKIPRHLPMLMLSGLEDPVGEYGKGVERAYKTYHDYLFDTELLLYEDCRHELLNELNKEDIYQDIYEWMQAHDFVK